MIKFVAWEKNRGEFYLIKNNEKASITSILKNIKLHPTPKWKLVGKSGGFLCHLFFEFKQDNNLLVFLGVYSTRNKFKRNFL